MLYDEFYGLVLKHLIKYKQEFLGVTENGIWKHKDMEYEKEHILPISLKKLNLLPSVYMPNIQGEHMYSHHLNSSQMMCLNFFAPFTKDMGGKSFLLELLIKIFGLPISENDTIESAMFEYLPKKVEGTNFDFYIKLKSGVNIFFEIKYTEKEFGGITLDSKKPLKYENKWDNVYKEHLSQSLYLKTMDKENFYRNYQIWRNISYIQNENDFVVFLIPFYNESLTKELDYTIRTNTTKEYKNVLACDWISITNSTLAYSKNTMYHSHFKMFYEKYLDVN